MYVLEGKGNFDVGLESEKMKDQVDKRNPKKSKIFKKTKILKFSKEN